ncbi:MAG: hypothetical protein HC927_09030 [Deltaproteobacteria bacterium]|nr:hypothetical protein [Deltaproteobacteria bacterium]
MARPGKDPNDPRLLVPQSVGLATVRDVVEAIAEHPESAASQAEIAALTGLEERHIFYALTAARALELLDADDTLTAKASSLLATEQGTPTEYATWRTLLTDSAHIRVYAHDLFSSVAPLSAQTLAARIQEATGYSPKTAADRANTLMAWKRLIDKKIGSPAQLSILPLEGASDSAPDPDDDEPSEPEPSLPSRSPGEEIPTVIPHLVLPRRYEKLEKAAREKNLDVANIVVRVEHEAARVDTLLRYVRDGGTGQFEVFFGPTGSGKTTFLRTLPKFFKNIEVTIIGRDIPHLLIPAFIARHSGVKSSAMQVYIIDERDNDRISSEDAEDFFEQLRIYFRKRAGEVLVIWPVTKQQLAEQLALTAHRIGGDSVVPLDSKGLHRFSGVSKDKYYEVADLTVQSLTGERLPAYGVSEEMARDAAREADTIGAFFSLLEQKTSALRAKTWTVLREKRRPRVWVLVAGDHEQYLNSTVAQLVQGVRGEVDLDRILAYLDDKRNAANYLKEWRNRRQEAAFLLRTLDVRILPLPPSVTLAAVRAFGGEQVRANLNTRSISTDACTKIVSRSRVHKLIVETLTGVPVAPAQGKRAYRTAAEEYSRIQQLASKHDKLLNRALGRALEHALKVEGHQIEVLIEKRKISDTNLQPDIQILTAREGETICLEPTWRTSGAGIAGELDPRQSSMKPGNIQQYMLDKVYEYVKAFGL